MRETIVRFGQIIEAKRKERGFTQQYLANLIDERVIFVQLVEKGRINPTFSDMDKLAEAFDITVFELLSGLSE